MIQTNSTFSSYFDSKVATFNTLNLATGQPVFNTTKIPVVLATVWNLKYRFEAHSHPLVTDLLSLLKNGGLQALLRADTDITPPTYSEQQLNAPSNILEGNLPENGFDFRPGSAYGVYNWELFFHAPLLMALHLSRNQRFEEAREWFHLIFDPTSVSSTTTAGAARFWNFKVFRDAPLALARDNLLNLVKGTNEEKQNETARSLGARKESPFSPHAVARYRPTAYMNHTVMAYLDNLIAWGDSLFRQDTRESINEAMQIYVLAANLLGPRPQEIPRRPRARSHSYESLREAADLYEAGAAELEADLPFDSLSLPPPVDVDARSRSIRGIASAKYFCVPPNPKLLSYWDTVADRLFKIRNSLNLEGTFRQLPLFAPPIDPGLLAAAAASGLDTAAVVRGLQQPLPYVRFQIMLQRATELCQEVKSLGGLLLSAMEKKDNEALTLLRATHETSILTRAESVRYQQYQEAKKQTEALKLSIVGAGQRLNHYRQLMGETSMDLPELAPLDANALKSMMFSSEEASLTYRDASIRVEQEQFDSLTGVDGTQARVSLTAREKRELTHLNWARNLMRLAAGARVAIPALSLIPDMGALAAFQGVGPTAKLSGGEKAAYAAKSAVDAVQTGADEFSFQATMVARESQYERRQQDWTVQYNASVSELNTLFKQLRAAQIRENVALTEWENHKKQIENAREVEEFLSNESKKKTGEQFYVWMSREAKGLHQRCFELAYDAALKAERALQHELGEPDRRFISTSYLKGKEGLLSGERLYFDLKRMEMAYIELNRREYEVTKHISLLQLDPMSLIQLRETGECEIELPEELFDVDGPGQYFRRIKTVSLSLPCVAGPHTSISCKLTQTKSSIRRKTGVAEGYAKKPQDDDRFSEAGGQVQSIVTSSGVNDAGLFELTLRDDRYLPFEGTGAISTWRVELPKEYRQFDYSTISDLVLHMRFTSRDGGTRLRNEAVANLRQMVGNATTKGLTRLLSLRHEFPSEWAHFIAGPSSGLKKVELSLREEHFPFWLKGARHVDSVGLAVRAKKSANPTNKIVVAESETLPPTPEELVLDATYSSGIEGDPGIFIGTVPGAPQNLNGPQTLLVYIDKTGVSAFEDIWFAVTLKSSST